MKAFCPVTKREVLEDAIVDCENAKFRVAGDREEYDRLVFVIAACESMIADPSVTLAEAIAYTERCRP